MPTIRLNPADNPGGGYTAPAPWLNLYDADAYVGPVQVLADCDDENGSPTGVSFWVDEGSINDSTFATPQSGTVAGWPGEVWVSYWILDTSNAGPMSYSLRGLPVGATYTAKIAAASANGGRNANITFTPANEGTQLYTNNGDLANPTPPITFTGTVPANGIVEFELLYTNLYAYFTGLEFTYDTGAAAPFRASLAT